MVTVTSSASYPHFVNMFVINNFANEKLVIMSSIGQNTAGPGNAVVRHESVCKWANTSSQVTSVIFNDDDTGQIAQNSFLKVWGSD